jgi:hypothetical protein
MHGALLKVRGNGRHRLTWSRRLFGKDRGFQLLYSRGVLVELHLYDVVEPAIDGGKAVMHFVAKVGKIVLGGHVILDEIHDLKNVLRVCVHNAGSIARRSSGHECADGVEIMHHENRRKKARILEAGTRSKIMQTACGVRRWVGGTKAGTCSLGKSGPTKRQTALPQENVLN